MGTRDSGTWFPPARGFRKEASTNHLTVPGTEVTGGGSYQVTHIESRESGGFSIGSNPAGVCPGPDERTGTPE